MGGLLGIVLLGVFASTAINPSGAQGLVHGIGDVLRQAAGGRRRLLGLRVLLHLRDAEGDRPDHAGARRRRGRRGARRRDARRGCVRTGRVRPLKPPGHAATTPPSRGRGPRRSRRAAAAHGSRDRTAARWPSPGRSCSRPFASSRASWTAFAGTVTRSSSPAITSVGCCSVPSQERLDQVAAASSWYA